MVATKTEWNKFYRYMRARWKQGEHVSVIGPTGRGKTHLSLALLPIRDYTVIFGVKPRDDTLTSYAKKHRYVIQDNFNPNLTKHRYLVWKKFEKAGDEKEQVKVFTNAFNEVFSQGNWCLYIDEVFYFNEMLNMGYYLSMFWTQARSNGISLFSATQRPRKVPLLMYDQATHLFFFKVTDDYARKRIGEIGGIDSKTVAREVASLGEHEFLYCNLKTDVRIISEVK